MQKKYLLVSLLAAATLLSGCSDDTGSPSNTGNDNGSNSGAVSNATPEEAGSTSAPTRTDGLINPSEPKSTATAAQTFEEAAVEVVRVPQSVIDSEGYVPIPLAETSGSVVESEDDVTMVFNDSFEKESLQQWVKDLEAEGWRVSTIDTVDTETAYNIVLLKPDRIIALYANNTSQTTNTVISISK